MKKAAYQLGLYEKAMPGTLSLEQLLEETAAAGFDTLEISIDESDGRLSRLDWTREEKLALRRASERAGVPIKTMCLSGHRKYPLGSHDPALRQRSLEILEKAVEFSQDVGVRIIQLAGYDVYYEEGDAQTESWFAENLHRCVEIAARGGVILGFETMETPFLDTVGKAMRWVREVDSPYLGVYPDIGNLKNASVVHGTPLVEDIASGAGHIFAVHLKETQPGIYRDMAFGTGHTEYLPCIRELWQQGVRHFTGEFWYDGAEDFRRTLRDSAAFLRQKIEEAVEV